MRGQEIQVERDQRCARRARSRRPSPAAGTLRPSASPCRCPRASAAPRHPWCASHRVAGRRHANDFALAAPPQQDLGWIDGKATPTIFWAKRSGAFEQPRAWPLAGPGRSTGPSGRHRLTTLGRAAVVGASRSRRTLSPSRSTARPAAALPPYANRLRRMVANSGAQEVKPPSAAQRARGTGSRFPGALPATAPPRAAGNTLLFYDSHQEEARVSVCRGKHQGTVAGGRRRAHRGRAAAAHDTRVASADVDVATAPVEIDGRVLFRLRGVSSFPAARAPGWSPTASSRRLPIPPRRWMGFASSRAASPRKSRSATGRS